MLSKKFEIEFSTTIRIEQGVDFVTVKDVDDIIKTAMLKFKKILSKELKKGELEELFTAIIWKITWMKRAMTVVDLMLIFAFIENYEIFEGYSDLPEESDYCLN